MDVVESGGKDMSRRLIVGISESKVERMKRIVDIKDCSNICI